MIPLCSVNIPWDVENRRIKERGELIELYNWCALSALVTSIKSHVVISGNKNINCVGWPNDKFRKTCQQILIMPNFG